MRGFAFRASLIVAMTNRSALFDRQKAGLQALKLGENATTESETRDEFLTLTSNWTQKLDFQDGLNSVTVYKAQWLYAAAAAALGVISVLSVASLFWGYWELGRSVSLNPLEIALAFDSAMLANVNSNSCRSQIVSTVGSQKVIYAGAGSGRVGGGGGGGGVEEFVNSEAEAAGAAAAAAEIGEEGHHNHFQVDDRLINHRRHGALQPQQQQQQQRRLLLLRRRLKFTQDERRHEYDNVEDEKEEDHARLPRPGDVFR